MLLSPRRCTTLGDLLRLGAVWLAVLLLLQGTAAVLALAAGPAHRHLAPAAAVASVHQHGTVERHHHAAPDDPVSAAAEAALDAALEEAAAALVVAFALLATTARLLRLPGRAGRDWWPAAAGLRLGVQGPPLLKPPQLR